MVACREGEGEEKGRGGARRRGRQDIRSFLSGVVLVNSWVLTDEPEYVPEREVVPEFCVVPPDRVHPHVGSPQAVVAVAVAVALVLSLPALLLRVRGTSGWQTLLFKKKAFASILVAANIS